MVPFLNPSRVSERSKRNRSGLNHCRGFLERAVHRLQGYCLFWGAHILRKCAVAAPRQISENFVIRSELPGVPSDCFNPPGDVVSWSFAFWLEKPDTHEPGESRLPGYVRKVIEVDARRVNPDEDFVVARGRLRNFRKA